MAIVESTGLQQVLTLSNVTTKAQQNTQKRIDVVNNNLVADAKVEDQRKKRDVSTLNKTDESQIRDEYTEQGGVKYKSRQREREEKENPDEEEDKGAVDVHGGKVVDIII